MQRSHILTTILCALIGLAGLLLVLFAWHLPPFAPAHPTTENAYLRGKVTVLAPQLSGYIQDVRVTDFQSVEKDQVIAVIDDRIYRQKLAQAEATHAAALSQMEIARQNVRSAEAVLGADEAAVFATDLAVQTAKSGNNRTSSLRERGVATQSASEQSALSLQQAISQHSQAQAALDVQREQLANARVQIGSAQAQIDSASAAVELAQLDLGNTVIRAPSAGRLGQVSVRVGQFVSPGVALASHIGTDLWVIANFKEEALDRVSAGEKVSFTVDALNGHRFTGRVEGISPATASEFSLLAGTNATGNFTKIAQRIPFRISIDPDQPRADQLTPGLSVIVSVIGTD